MEHARVTQGEVQALTPQGSLVPGPSRTTAVHDEVSGIEATASSVLLSRCKTAQAIYRRKDKLKALNSVNLPDDAVSPRAGEESTHWKLPSAAHWTSRNQDRGRPWSLPEGSACCRVRFNCKCEIPLQSKSLSSFGHPRDESLICLSACSFGVFCWHGRVGQNCGICQSCSPIKGAR